VFGRKYDAPVGVHRFSITIDAPPDAVFALWTDLDRMRDWVGGVTGVADITGPVDQAGTTYTVLFGRMRSPTTVLEADRPRHIHTRFGNPILKGESDVTFEPDGDGTLLTQEFRTRGIVSAVAARVFATGSYKGSFRGELDAFRRIAEREARPTMAP
jgi:uncharacterized protein YndB with AHSA1/START domain